MIVHLLISFQGIRIDLREQPRLQPLADRAHFPRHLCRYDDRRELRSALATKLCVLPENDLHVCILQQHSCLTPKQYTNQEQTSDSCATTVESLSLSSASRQRSCEFIHPLSGRAAVQLQARRGRPRGLLLIDMCVLRGAMIVPVSLFGKWSHRRKQSRDPSVVCYRLDMREVHAKPYAIAGFGWTTFPWYAKSLRRIRPWFRALRPGLDPCRGSLLLTMGW